MAHLCGLLRIGIWCLKGGQSLQYTSLLLINKIIDVCISLDISLVDIKLADNQSNCDNQVKNKCSKNKRVTKDKDKETLHKSVVDSQNPSLSTTHSKSDTDINSNHISGGSLRHFLKKKSQHRFSRKTISDWLRLKSLSTRLTGQASQKDRPPTLSASNGCDISRSDRSLGPNSGQPSGTSLLSVVVNEGIDLILNVLNNAITLHKRVSGSKQCCTPSKR